MKISLEAFREVDDALERYKEIVDRTELTESTKHTYVLHAEHFVRWLKDDFLPGITKEGRPLGR